MEHRRFFIDLVKYWLSVGASRALPRLKTGIEVVFLLLTYKGYLRPDASALEVFGMHGLWHTKYYLKYIGHLDIFEINKTYSRLSRLALGTRKVSFYHQDSLIYLSETERKYDLVVADTPVAGGFFEADGLPRFWKDLIQVTAPRGIVIFNVLTEFVSSNRSFPTTVMKALHGRRLRDFFFVPRNDVMCYGVVVLDD